MYVAVFRETFNNYLEMETIVYNSKILVILHGESGSDSEEKLFNSAREKINYSFYV